ncbi:MAG: efflux RND transporter periplasmic adaptor subunit, partial [Selenomonadaceae bacterium]|nr:efflux RND transporter periplasmic adaptor subunit [Selenomonadaceae bacterium]
YSNDMADAVSLIEGRIVECLAFKGTFVRQGQVIFVLENDAIPLQMEEMESNILRARAELKHAENNYSRYQSLLERNAAAQQQFDDAQAAYIAAQSSLKVAESKAAQLRVQESRQQVIAPIDGKIVVLYRQQGAYVQGGTSLALVGDFRSLYLTAPVGDEDASHLMVGEEAELVFQSMDSQKAYGTDYGSGNLDSRQKFTAVIDQITPPLSEPAVMRNVLWRVDNSSELLEPQTYGRVSFQSKSSREALAIPLAAMADSSRASVFVVRGDGTTEWRAVRTGANDGTYIEVLSGLSVGEVVVTSGMEGLTDGAQVEVVLDETEGGGSGGA